MSKQLLFSLNKKDFIIQPFIDSGNGGQKRNKTMSCCRIIHPDSGARAEGTRQRSFFQNRNDAFKRLVEKSEFQKWHKIKVAKALGNMIDEESWVDQQMDLRNLRFEVKENGKWKTVKYSDIKEIDFDDLEDG